MWNISISVEDINHATIPTACRPKIGFGYSLFCSQFMTTALLETLVGFPTVSRDSHLNMIAFIEAWCDNQGFEHRRVDSDDGTKANLLARISCSPPSPCTCWGVAARRCHSIGAVQPPAAPAQGMTAPRAPDPLTGHGGRDACLDRATGTPGPVDAFP